MGDTNGGDNDNDSKTSKQYFQSWKEEAALLKQN